MDVHRSRFVPYPTSAISSLAFSRSSDSGYTGPLPALKLAIGRANGNIEIWNPQRGSWVQETIFTGDGRSIDGLQWTQEPNDIDADGQVKIGQHRLFSIASSPNVTEWDLGTGRPKRQSTGNFSEVWCFAAQPRRKPQQDAEGAALCQDIVAGCGDGTLVLLSTEDNDLQFKRFLARVSGKRARCMSVTYQRQDRAVAGFADGVIRIYDTKNGSMVRTMTLGTGIPGAPKNTLVWQVRCLPNGDIVSGDSNGEVRFWDGRTYSQTQRIATHDTDCLDLVMSSDGKTVFTGSIDGKVALLRKSHEGDRAVWAKSSQRRMHKGEVKAMAAFDSKAFSVVVSGGSDAAPMVMPLRAYGKENLRSLPALPQTPPVTSAPRARLLVSWAEKTVWIWRIARRLEETGTDDHQSPRKLVARVELATAHNIQTASITSDGKVLAIATQAEVKVFQLRRRVGHDSLAVRKLDVPKALASEGARLVSFSPDSKWLATVTANDEIYVARLTADASKPKHIQILPKVVELERLDRLRIEQTAFREYDRTITRATFALDGSALVVSDLSGHIDSWILKGSEDMTVPPSASVSHQRTDDSPSNSSDSDSDTSDEDEGDQIAFYGQIWVTNPACHLLPKLDSPLLILSFRPPRIVSDTPLLTNGHTTSTFTAKSHPPAPDPADRHLWILTTRHQIHEFDLSTGRLTDWSRRNPSSAFLPPDFVKIRDRVVGALWDCAVGSEKQRVWLYGVNFVCMLDLRFGDLGTDDAESDAAGGVKRKRKSKAEVDGVDERKMRRVESGAGGPTASSHRLGIAATEEGRYADESEGYDGRDSDEDDDIGLPLTLTRFRSSEDERALESRHGAAEGKQRQWWCTFKYRPILGIVPLSSDDADVEGDSPMEVVLVERPVWDVAQKAR